MPNEEQFVRAVTRSLLELTKDASCVTIGEASHGTHEFYRQRAQLTKRLISEQGFSHVG